VVDRRSFLAASCAPLRRWSSSSSSSAAAAAASERGHDGDGGEIGSGGQASNFESRVPGNGGKSAPTPLFKESLCRDIAFRGPISVATYMRQALTHPVHGYYMNKDTFGREGDFITSPELSQMFGEVLGIWCTDMWERIGRPAEWNLIEFGPGRGSLMQDMLRVLKQTPQIFGGMNIHMIEVSPYMRKKQAATLGCDSSLFDKVVKPSGGQEGDQEAKPREESAVASGPLAKEQAIVSSPVVFGTNEIKVQWHSSFSGVPSGIPFLIIAHEFFDALPIYTFELTQQGWREWLIDLEHGDGPHQLRYVLSSGPTFASLSLLARIGITGKTSNSGVSYGGASGAGDCIEICAEGMGLVEDISNRIAGVRGRGAALVIDYGQDRLQGNTLRAIKKHQIQHVLCEPGLADITADVDFSTLRRVARQTPSVTTYGPQPQGEFLRQLGIDARMAILLKNARGDSQTKSLIATYERLVNEDQMGLTYKAMTICGRDGTHPPLGFL